MIVIRPVSNDETRLLGELSRDTFYETFAAQNTKEDMDLYLREELSDTKLRIEMEAPGAAFYFLIWQNTPIGYLKLHHFAQAKKMEIERIYLKQEHQGKRFGKALLEFAIHEARRNHSTEIFLGVWQLNHKAIRFYELNGFEIFDQHTFQLGNDLQQDWLMRLSL